MKKFIVSWWNGQELVVAGDADEAREIVRNKSLDYIEFGRGSNLFVKEA